MFLAIAAAVLAACADLNGVGISDDLAAAQARWEATHLQDYQFDFQRSCFCGPVVTSPVTITVWHGAFLSMVYRDSVSAAADTTYFQQYLTMERIFAFLHAELDAHPASFTAVYDTSSGYPRQVAVDPIANAADDEHSFVITAVRPLP